MELIKEKKTQFERDNIDLQLLECLGPLYPQVQSCRIYSMSLSYCDVLDASNQICC